MELVGASSPAVHTAEQCLAHRGASNPRPPHSNHPHTSKQIRPRTYPSTISLFPPLQAKTLPSTSMSQQRLDMGDG